MVDSLSLISTIEANCDSIFTPEALELIREVLMPINYNMTHMNHTLL